MSLEDLAEAAEPDPDDAARTISGLVVEAGRQPGRLPGLLGRRLGQENEARRTADLARIIKPVERLEVRHDARGIVTGSA